MLAKLDDHALDRAIGQDVQMLNAALRDRERHLEAVAGCEKSAVLTAWRLGGRLLERKKRLPHGEWLPWLRSVEIPERSARDYMRLATQIGSAADLGPSIRATLRALPKPEEETKAAIEYAMATFRAVRDALRPGSDEHSRCIQCMPDGPVSTTRWLDFAAALADAESEDDYRTAGKLLPWIAGAQRQERT